MKLTTPLKIFLSVALLAGGAQAASLSLGAGGLTPSHGANPGTLVYTDPSGIKISYNGQPHDPAGPATGYISGANARGWNNDATGSQFGFPEVTVDHLAIAHFDPSPSSAESVVIDFSGATPAIATATLIVYDLDTNGTFTEDLTWTNGGNAGVLNGDPGAIAGVQTHTLVIPDVGASLVLTPNVNVGSGMGLSAFDIRYTVVPEPSTGLLALLGGSLLFFRRRK